MTEPRTVKGAALGLLVLLPVDCDPLHLLLRAGRLRQSHREHAIFEGRVDLILIDALNRNLPLEAAIEPLAKAPFLVFRFGPLLAADGENAVGKFNGDVLL